MQDELIIRPLRPTDSIPAITQLLHRAYAGLAAMGFRYVATHQDDATTHRRLHEGFAWIAQLNGTLVGTVTLYGPSEAAACAWYRRPRVFHFGQFGVEPQLQRHGVGSKLHQHIEDHARAMGAHELALDTAEHAHHLVQWYTRLGYRFITFESWDVTNYRSVIMSKLLVSP